MDQATLVGPQIDDVSKLVDQLRRDGFDVKAAFWSYRSEADQWYLHLASDAVDQKGLFEAYMALGRAMRQLPDLSIGPFEVKLVPPDDPVAKAVIDFLAKRPARTPARIRGENLGGIHIEYAYLYNI
jgi:hypothetical protein